MAISAACRILSGVSLPRPVKAELIDGARNSQKVDANLSKLTEFFKPFVSLPFDDLAETSDNASFKEFESAH